MFFNSKLSKNTTTTALDNGESYEGTWVDVSKYSKVRAYIKTDQTTTMKLQFSPDGTNIDSSLSYTVTADVPAVHRLAVTRPYFRMVIENNSGSNQTYLRAGVLLYQENGTLTAPINTNQRQYADTDTNSTILSLRFSLVEYENVTS